MLIYLTGRPMKFKQNPRNIDSIIMDESFQRWISGKGNKSDTEKWEKWLNAHPRNKTLLEEAVTLWQAGQFKSHRLPDVQNELNNLLTNLGLTVDRQEKEAKKARSLILPLNTGRLWKIGAAVITAAAILFIVARLNFSILLPAFGNKYTTVSTHYGERTKLVLADGSTVILNGHSTLKYPAHFTSGTKRKLFLKGEAYFEVTKKPAGPQHNFTVTTKEGMISVIGTKFTVYSRNNQTRVALLQGQIKVMAKTESDTNKVSASVIMSPGESLKFVKNAQKLNPESTISSLQSSWWKDRLTLNNTSLKEMISWMKETYGIEVTISDETLLKRTISGSIENNNLDLIIETLSKVLQVPVTIKGNQVIFEKSNI